MKTEVQSLSKISKQTIRNWQNSIPDPIQDTLWEKTTLI